MNGVSSAELFSKGEAAAGCSSSRITLAYRVSRQEGCGKAGARKSNDYGTRRKLKTPAQVLRMTHHLCQNHSMAKRSSLFKDTDDEARFRCAGGVGILREEAWVDAEGKVVQYNLAFLLPHLSGIDNGRVLGYDNAHGVHERHFMGQVKLVEFEDYSLLAKRFYREAEALRRSYEERR
jgi:hypothetical protein